MGVESQRVEEFRLTKEPYYLPLGDEVELFEAAYNARLTVMLKGPISAPKRSVDAAAFASWLALRAVEQQSKKLEALEGRPPAAPSYVPAAAATANANPRTTPVQTAPALDAPVPAAAPTEPDAPGARPAARTQPATPSVQKPKPVAPTAERAPALPPPIDIRPAPAPRAVGTHGTAQSQPQKPVAAPAPARQRSLSEILFGN